MDLVRTEFGVYSKEYSVKVLTKLSRTWIITFVLVLISPKCGHLRINICFLRLLYGPRGQPAEQPCPCLCSSAWKETQTAIEGEILQPVKWRKADPTQTEEHPQQSDQMSSQPVSIPQPGTQRNAAPNPLRAAPAFPIPQPNAHPQQQPKALLARPVKNPQTGVDEGMKTDSLSLMALEIIVLCHCCGWDRTWSTGNAPAASEEQITDLGKFRSPAVST